MSKEELHFTDHKQQQAHTIGIAKMYNIDVKNIKHFKGHDGMTGINADIYHKGIKIATAYDDARGGEMEINYIHKVPATREILNKIDQKLKVLPKYSVEFSEDINGGPVGGEPIMYSSNVDLASIVDAIALEKEERRIFNREKKKYIIFTTKDGKEHVYQWKWQLAHFITKYPKAGLETIQSACDELIEEGSTIVNKEYIKSLGVNI